MSDTSLLFNVIAKDNASATFNRVGAAAKIALAVAAAAIVKFGIDSAQAYAEAEQAQLKLEEAFVKFPNIADTNIERLRALNTALAQKTKFDDDATATGQATLAQFQLTGAQIEKLTPLMQDFAAKTGMDLPSAATALGKALLGQGRALKQVGIDFKDAGSVGANFDQIVSGLTEKVGGFAEKQGQTAAGQVEILKNQFGELQEKIGGMLVPQLLKLVPILEKTIAFFDRNADTIIKVGLAVGGLIVAVKAITLIQKGWTAAVMVWSVLQKAVTIGQWLWNAAMYANPIGLIIIAVLALVAVFVILWMKSEGFRNFFIGMWDSIWGFLKMIGAWFAGPFVDFFKGVWANINDSVGRLKNIFFGLIDWFKTTFQSVRQFLLAPFVAAFNKVADVWNNTVGRLYWQVPSWVPFIGGNTISAPKMPHLYAMAEGGIVTRPTVALLGEAGPEAVIPLARGGAGGGVTVTFDFRGMDSEMAKAIRKTVRLKGAGNVQTAFGR